MFCEFFRGKKMRVKCFYDFLEGKNESDFFVIFLGKMGNLKGIRIKGFCD